MDYLNNSKVNKVKRPIRVLQFGEGNFLRAFADFMIDVANEKGYFDGDIIMVKPTRSMRNVDSLKRQDCRYTVMLRGVINGEESIETRVITSVADIIHPHKEYQKYSKVAALDTLRFIISNTTEAGITYDETDQLDLEPPKSYPGKLAKFLYERYQYFHGDKEKGLIILPVELIDDNGTQLKRFILKLADLWGLEPKFIQWLNEACVFCNTLVDRIVTGFPEEEAEGIWRKLGYKDDLLVAGEPFGLWVIESDKPIEDEFPIHKAGMPVIFTKDQTPYRLRKVRILNGAHSSFALASFLSGNDDVLESMQDDLVRNFIHKTVYDEIIPNLDLPREDMLSFAAAVKDRFENPFNKHLLLSISLNAVSKWKVRVLPSILAYIERKGMLPTNLTFSLAALMQFYTGQELRDDALIAYRGETEYYISDDKPVLEFFYRYSNEMPEQLVPRFLAREDFWGQNLNHIFGFTDKVIGYLKGIRSKGMRNAMKDLQANE